MEHHYPRFSSFELQYLPSDVLLQVLYHMNPLSLLELSRTSKRFRKTVMSRSSRFIWKRVLAQIHGLPKCPDDLTEPQYAYLAFDPYCDLCFVPRVTEIYWACRIKCCLDCMMGHFHSFVIEGFETEPYRYERYVPCINNLQGRAFRPKDIEEFNDKRLCFFQGSAGETQFLREREAMVKDRIQHEEACREWKKSLNVIPSGDENENARSRRKNAIIDKLEERGWSAELASMDNKTETAFSRLREVNKQRPLTERIWRNIRTDVVAFMQEIRSKRESEIWVQKLSERVAIVKEMRITFLNSRPIDEPQPSLADICSMQTFQTSLSMPSAHVLTDDILNQLRLSIPGLAESWRQYASKKLVGMLPLLSPSHLPLTLQRRLALATSFFKCSKGCLDPIGYPKILVHRCTTSTLDPLPILDGPSSDYHQSLSKILRQQPWNINGDRISFNPEAAAAAHIVVEAAGFDPGLVTARDMNKIDLWFVCSFCSNGGGELEGLFVMSWDAAVSHCINKHEGSMQITDWATLEPGCQVTRGCADVIDMVSFFTLDYACYREGCGEHLAFQAVPAHMKDKHGLIYESDDCRSAYDDCYRHLDASPPKPIRIKIPVRP